MPRRSYWLIYTTRGLSDHISATRGTTLALSPHARKAAGAAAINRHPACALVAVSDATPPRKRGVADREPCSPRPARGSAVQARTRTAMRIWRRRTPHTVGDCSRAQQVRSHGGRSRCPAPCGTPPGRAHARPEYHAAEPLIAQLKRSRGQVPLFRPFQ